MDQDQWPSDAAVFRAWVDEEFVPRALERRIRPAVLHRAMAEATFLPEVIERQADQSEFSLPIREYLDITASDERARIGRQMLRRHRDLLNRIEMTFSVEPEVVAAIWGLETGYGVVPGRFPVISALATLAFRGRRAALFEDQLIAALRMVQTHKVKPETMFGSWAGAMGHGQFMPTSVLGFGVDFDGDGRLDLWGEDPSDALASIANYLKKHGWKTGQPWGLEVRLPAAFDYGLAAPDAARPTRDWAAMGVTDATGGALPDYGAGTILLPAGHRGAALLVLRNFLVLTAYNRAQSYAIAIGHLSDRIAGGKPFRKAWPEDQTPLSRTDVVTAQVLLTQAGFDTQGIDGFVGQNTERAVRAFQAVHAMVPDGHLDSAFLDQLREIAADPG